MPSLISAPTLDGAFWRSLSELRNAAIRGGSTADVEEDITRVQQSLHALYTSLRDELEPRLGSASPEPTIKRVRDYVAKGSNRLDWDMRFYFGRWNGDVKLVVVVSPVAGLEVFLTSWMANAAAGETLSTFLDEQGDWVRSQLRAVSKSLEDRFGVLLVLKHSIRIGSHSADARGWLEDDADWGNWCKNKLGQASVGLWLEGGVDREYVLRTARADASGAPLWAAPRIIGGLAGRRAATSGEGDLEALVDRAADETKLATRSLIADERLTELAHAAATGLADVLVGLRRHATRPRVSPVGPIAFDASALDIAGALLLSAGDHTIEGAPLRASGDERCAVVGWGLKTRPWLEVERLSGGALKLVFHASVTDGRYADPYRTRLAARLSGRTGNALADLVRAGGGMIAPTCGDRACGARGRCATASLADHWLLAGRKPRLAWSIASDGGDPDWLAVPGQLLFSLLLQAVDEPPELVVPELSERSWDVFVSTPGSGIGFTGTAIRDSLLSAHHLSSWYMADHERVGRDITDNTSEGIERSGVVLVVLHESYWDSKYCVSEFLEAVSRGRPLLPIVVTASGNPEDVEGQRVSARTGLLEHCGRYSPDVVQRAILAADRLLGDTIRVAVREGDKSLPPAKLRIVARRVHELLGERA